MRRATPLFGCFQKFAFWSEPVNYPLRIIYYTREKERLLVGRISVGQLLEVAYQTGQQVTLGLKSGKKLEGVVVEALWETSFRIWLDPAELSGDVNKAIVGKFAVESVEFGID